MQLPLLGAWRISAQSLPEPLLTPCDAPGFVLPGAQALLEYAELLGENTQEDAPASPEQSAPFPLPAMIPDELGGEVTLTCEVDFGAVSGDRAILTFDRLHGSGSILLGDVAIASFDSAHPALMNAEKALALTAAPCMLALDVTDAMRRGRRETLTLRFDSARPAGVSGAIILQTTQDAFLCNPLLLPDPETITARIQISTLRTGEYALRLFAAPPIPDGSEIPAREIILTLQAGEVRNAELTFSLPARRFSPGTPYASPSVKIQLWRMPDNGAKRPHILCDSVTLSCGYPSLAPLSFVPLSMQDVEMPAQALCDLLRSVHISGVSLDAPAAESFYRAMTRAGIGVLLQTDMSSAAARRLLRHPCLTLTDSAPVSAPLSYAASAWQLCGMTGQERSVDPGLTDSTLLHEAAGRRLDPHDPGICDVLQWLRSVSVRLRCEAARQQRYAGPLCAPGEIHISDVAEAMQTAFRPTHLSALPLCGAWWTDTHFSAMLEAFIDPSGSDWYGPLTAMAVLEDSEGHELARLCAPCRAKGGYIGMIDAQLPDTACVLELRTQLLCGEEVIEESMLPVYVGDRGPLEAAFAP